MTTGDDLKDLIRGIKVVPQDVAESSLFVICGHPPGYFPDDQAAFCSECGHGIVHRPTAPKKPKKICSCCARRIVPTLIDAHAAATGQTVEEVVQFVNNSQAGADFVKKKWGS